MTRLCTMKLPLRALPILAALVLAATNARATARVDRNDGTLSGADVAALVADGARWPFDLHVLVGSFAQRTDLVQAVHACVTVPLAVCVGVDPGHHFTETHFGGGVGVQPGDFNRIASSGNGRFKAGDWRGGIEAIADRAAELSYRTTVSGMGAATVPVSMQPPAVIVVPQASDSHWVLWTLVGLLAVGSIVIAWRVRRRQKETEADMQRLHDERMEAEARGAEEREWHQKMGGTMPAATRTQSGARRKAVTPAPVASAPSTVVVQQGGGGGNDLLAFELGRMSASPRIVEREVVHERVSSGTSDSGGAGSEWGAFGSSDSGGGGSDWSSSDSGSSSWDSGSSSWDSGGSDFGGGSSDSGGGGSDW